MERGGRGYPPPVRWCCSPPGTRPGRGSLSSRIRADRGSRAWYRAQVVAGAGDARPPTLDVCRGKLRRYEAWGFPEVGAEAPDRPAPSRPRGRLPSLTIHLLEGGAYRVSPESPAFPGWRAEAIHEAMNEAERSLRTDGILEELGRRMGARDGTGPDDDALMRSIRSQSRVEGERKGRAEGLAEGVRKGRLEGHTDTLGKLARRMLRSRGVEVSERFFADPVFAASSGEAVFDAAFACSSEARLLAVLRRRTAAGGPGG